MIVLHPDFVEFIPHELEEGILYVSLKYNAVGHKCPCGCGNLVFTPLSPNDWQLCYNGEGVSLTPSIGNWSYDCHSHYWIINNEVHFAGKWTDKRIKRAIKKQAKKKELFFKKKKGDN